jgi:hypothetical protein
MGCCRGRLNERLLWVMVVLVHASYVIGPEELAKLVASLYYKNFDTQWEATVAHQSVQSPV